MDKDIQKLTQNERYDLKRKQLKEEWNAYYNNLLDGLKTVENKKVVIEKEVKVANCDLMTENKKLKEQLKDYEKTLKEYADGYNYAYVDNGFAFYSNQYSNEGLAQEVLEKWEVE